MPLPVLSTDRLVLRPFHLGDAPTVQSLAGVKAVAATTLTIPHPYPDGGAEEWIDTHVPAWEAGRSLALAVTTEEDGVIGTIAFVKINHDHRKAELGYWIGLPFWNRGFVTEAAQALLDYGFDTLALNRIEAQFLTRNPASGRVLEKLGMKHEGVRRQYVIKWGVAEDVGCCAILSGQR